MHLKLHFFPAAFPDETLHSVISRYARLCGVRNCQEAFAGLKSAAAFSQNVYPLHKPHIQSRHLMPEAMLPISLPVAHN